MASSEKSVNDDAKKVVLGSLLNNADAPSKKVISSYNFNASYKANLDKIKAHNATVLEACASYIILAPGQRTNSTWNNVALSRVPQEK